ncbi:MAG: lipase maturation factor family protein [Chthoniobacterales bacterium]
MEERKTGAKPVLYWDVDCSFCRRWVDRWSATTGEAVDYRPLQTASADVVAAAGDGRFERIVLALPDGKLLTGAAAALTSLAPHDPDARAALAICRRLPFLGRAAEHAYRWVAEHRVLCGRLTNLLWGRTTRTPCYEISGWLFPRLAGLIFLCAFVSLWVQIDGLTGSRGILPVAEHLEALRAHFTAQGSPMTAWSQVPSLLWLGADDRMLHIWLAAGVLAALVLFLGWWPAGAAFAAWALYLSFAAAIPVFLNFQWDALLLETGFLVIFYAAWRLRLRLGASAPTRLGRLLVWWLLFRLMFESGVVKLYGFDATGQNTWLDGTALDFHYFTQPIPVWVSWWFAQLPSWCQKLSLLAVFFIELVLPFFIFGPRRLRLTAFWGFTLLMALIMASGHYGFFNLLTLALCVTLVDDASWPAAVRRLIGSRPVQPPLPRRAAERLQHKILPWVAAVLFVITFAQLLLVLRILPFSRVAPVLGPVAPFRSANSYGLFSVMTTERPEITIEASADGVAWQPYRFRWKMEADDTSLPFALLHMPRLDWQMWFAALEYRSSGQPPGWIMPLLARLQEQSPPVLELLAPGPANDLAPAYFRLRLENFAFTTPATRRETGRYWEAVPLPPYTIEGRLQPGP